MRLTAEVRKARDARLQRANAAIVAIGSVGRHFFRHAAPDGERFARFEFDGDRLWFVDDYTGKRIYMHMPDGRRWRGFSHGGTMRRLVEAMRDYILCHTGPTPVLNHIAPLPEWAGGDVWGYGDHAMGQVRTAVRHLLGAAPRQYRCPTGAGATVEANGAESPIGRRP